MSRLPYSFMNDWKVFILCSTSERSFYRRHLPSTLESIQNGYFGDCTPCNYRNRCKLLQTQCCRHLSIGCTIAVWSCCNPPLHQPQFPKLGFARVGGTRRTSHASCDRVITSIYGLTLGPGYYYRYEYR